LDDVDFGLAVMKRKLPTPPTPATDLRDWVALKASIGSVSLEGVPGITVSGSGLTLSLSQGGGTDSNGANTTVVDFSTPLEIDAGGGNHVTLDFAGSEGKLLEVSGTLSVGISDFFTASGTFFFKKSTLEIGGSPSEVVQIATTGAAASLSVGGVTVSANGVDGAFLFGPVGVAGKLNVQSFS